MTRALPATLALLLAAVPAAIADDPATVVFSSGEGGSFPKTVTCGRDKIEVDLSALGKGVGVFRAVLRPGGDIDRGVRWHGDDRPLPVKVTVAGSDRGLPLLPPRYRGFVCTDAVADAVRTGTATLAFRVVALRGYDRKTARLEVTCGLRTKRKLPRVKGIEARHKDGQTFITWMHPNPPAARLGPEKAKARTLTVKEYKQLVAKLEADEDRVGFRIYRHTRPITAETIGRARLVDEVGQLTGWNTEYQGKYTLRSKKGGTVYRYVAKDGEAPTPPGTGVYAHNPARPGQAWYAVTVAVNGEEDLSAFDDGNATARPVVETVGQGAPVLQRVRKPGEYEHHYYNKDATLHDFTRWEAPPNCNRPSRPLDYLVGVLPDRPAKAPLALRLHGWGGSMHGGGFWVDAHEGTIMLSTNQLPYDWWTGYHEYVGTWKSWREGAVRDYTQTRLLSMVDWVNTRWPVDMTRVSVGGGSMGGSGTTNLAVHHGGRIAWAAGSVGVHIPDSSPQFTSSYIHCYGQVRWQLPFEDTGVSAFNWFSNEWYVLNRPKADIGLVCFSNGKNDGQIGWPQAVRFWKAMQKARQPHLFKWGLGGHGEGVRVPRREYRDEKGRRIRDVIDCRTDQTLPAFTHCSLDDDPGDAVAKPREQYETEKAEVKAWNKAHPKQKRRYDRYDGDQSGLSNGYLYWDTAEAHVVDAPDRWAMVLWLIDDAPEDACTVDVTPRRCRGFRPQPGQKLTWTNFRRDGDGWKQIDTGTVKADRWGLVTVGKVRVTKGRNRLLIERK